MTGRLETESVVAGIGDPGRKRQRGRAAGIADPGYNYSRTAVASLPLRVRR